MPTGSMHACTDEAHAQAVAPAAPLGVVGWAALGGFLAGFAMETVADAQKFAFKNKHPDRCSTPCKVGLVCLHGKKVFLFCDANDYV